MGKFLLTNAEVRVDGVNLSGYSHSLDTPESADQVDVSGFNAARLREFLAGLKDQTITIGMLQDFATGGPHQTLQPLFASGDTFELWVIPESTAFAGGTATVGVDNPAFGGVAQLFDYNGLSGELNARGEITATFKPASNQAFTWVTTDPGT